MSDSTLEHCAENEMRFQFRKAVSKGIRDNCPDGDPMVTGVTVMIGSIIAMAVFTTMLGRNARGRTR